MPQKSDQILSIPLSFKWPQDLQVWRVALFKEGNFLSQNCFSRGSHPRRPGGISSFNFQGGICFMTFQKIVETSHSPKVKNFFWCSISNSLPTNVNLAKRGVSSYFVYSRCGYENETVTHILKECSWISGVWFHSPISLSLRFNQSISFQEWAEYFFSKGDESQIEVFCMVA